MGTVRLTSLLTFSSIQVGGRLPQRMRQRLAPAITSWMIFQPLPSFPQNPLYPLVGTATAPGYGRGNGGDPVHCHAGYRSDGRAVLSHTVTGPPATYPSRWY